MHKRTYCIRSLEMRTMHTAFTHGAYFPGSINRLAREKLCCLSLLNLTSTAKSGLWGTHEVALVECLPYPETPSVEQTINNRRRTMKKLIVTLGCLLIALLAFAQPSSTDKKQGTTTTEPIEVTGTIIRTMIAEGAAASYQPRNTLVVREDSSNNPGRYVLNGRGHVVNKAGEIVQTAIKPGTRVRVYYADMGDLRMIDHVVVID